MILSTRTMGDDAVPTVAAPSRLTWFAIGVVAALFGGNILGLGRAGLSRVQRRIER